MSADTSVFSKKILQKQGAIDINSIVVFIIILSFCLGGFIIYSVYTI